ncbi:MAG TPA: hypothetical protein VHG93_24390 [Longimicrobium sp.]|nr:hypothetical protein [Longimicrobium sp.]
MRVIFDAGRQRWKIWFVLPMSLLVGAVLVWLGGTMLQSYGLDAAEGGVLKPLQIRILLALAFGLPGLAIIAGILAYLPCYVTRIEADEADESGDALRITVAALSPRLTVRPDDVVRAACSEGVYANGRGMHVNAPWYTLRLRGRRLPLIVDLQGDFIEPDAVERLMSGEPAPAAVEQSKGRSRDHRRRRR